MFRRFALLFLFVLALGGLLLAADWWICLPEGETATYVGREECARCHEEEMKLWAGSDHDRAMDLATPETVLGNFDNQEFTHQKDGEDGFRGVTSKLFRRDDEFFVTTDGPTGEMETYPIKYVFGVRPLQQYLIEFPDGRVQCLPITWDTENERWYHLYPDEDIPAGDVLHWTGPLQNWNYMCAECHSTNLLKNFNLKDNTYKTTWSEIDVSCETCHGPGSLHVKLADSKGIFPDRRYGYGLPRLKDPDSRVEVEMCAPCHSRRRVVYPNFRDNRPLPDGPGQKFLDYYVPELLDGNLYHADGQILEEDYVYGSFIQSKMYAKGVRCTDCHDPHTARLKTTDPSAPWDTPPDNRLCTDCHMGTHPAGEYDTQAHHHHPDSSQPGTLCVECHMPETTYMGVDPRRDHSMRSPRPDLTRWLGIPNACTGCHHDESKGETPEWAEQKLTEWYGERKGPTHFAYAIAAGREGKPEGERLLEALTRQKETPALVRATAIVLLGRYATDTGRDVAVRGLEDPEELVRVAAVRALQHLPPEELQRRLTPMLHDPIRAVRTEAARSLSRVPVNQFNESDRKALDDALTQYMTGQEAVGDQAAAHLNMAVIHSNRGDPEKAEQEYLTALRLDPQFVPARINLAMLCDRQDKKDEAAKWFREVLELEPELAEIHYSLGLLLAEDETRLAEAAESLAEAARLAPDNPRIHYNYGLALQRLKRPGDAERELSAAYKLAPGVSAYLHALAILYSQEGRWSDAIKCAEELVRREPGNRQMHALLQYLQRGAAEANPPE